MVKKDSDWRIAIEISAYSTSDTEHSFHDRWYPSTVSNFYSKPMDEYEISKFKDYNMGLYETGYTWGTRPGIWSRNTGWRYRHGRQDSKSIVRLFGYSCNPAFARPLPKVDVITCFVVRQQSHHRIGAKLLYQILDSLPKLENTNFELWREFSRTEQQATDMGIFSSP